MKTISPQWPLPNKVRVYTTTRQEGYSTAPFDSMNMAMHVADDAHAVMNNRRLLKEKLVLPTEPSWLTQVHGIEVVDAATCALDSDADASFTTQEKVVCAVMTADCLPVVFCNKQANWIATAHAGWKGLAAGVLEKTIEQYSGDIGDVFCWFGPAISKQHFEVGGDVYTAFIEQSDHYSDAFKPSDKSGHWYADLYLLARLRLEDKGIRHFFGGDRCSYEDSDLFYSYRRSKRTGRMVTVAWLE